MSSAIQNAVKALSSTVNVSTGLSHPNDMNKARELFAILHKKNEILLKGEFESYALSHGWSVIDADKLECLAQ